MRNALLGLKDTLKREASMSILLHVYSVSSRHFEGGGDGQVPFSLSLSPPPPNEICMVTVQGQLKSHMKKSQTLYRTVL